MTNRRSPAWRLFILMIGAIALLGLVAAACGDDDDGGNDNDNGDPTATTDDGNGDGDDDGDGDGDNDADADADGNGNGNGDGDGGSLTDLFDAIDQYELFTGVVTYDTSNFSAEGDLGTMSIYQDGTSLRYDIGTEGDESIIITTPDATYQCADDMCLKLPSTETPAGGIASFSSVFGAAAIASSIGALPDGIDVEVSSESIAGIDATCFEYSGDLDATEAGDESSEMCFSSSGLLLRAVFDDASGGGSIVATSASETAPDPSVFEPPYPVEEFDTDLPDEVCDLFPDLC